MKVQEISEGAYFVAGDWDQTLTNGHLSYSNQIVAESGDGEVSDDDQSEVKPDLPEGDWS